MTTSGHCLVGGRLSSQIVPLSRNHLITCENSSKGIRTSVAHLIARPCPDTPVQSLTAQESLSLAQTSLNISRSVQNLTKMVIAIAAKISKTRAHAAVSSIWTWSRERRKAYSPGKLSKRSCLCCKESWNTTCTRSLRTEASHKEILTSWPSQRIWKTWINNQPLSQWCLIKPLKSPYLYREQRMDNYSKKSQSSSTTSKANR